MSAACVFINGESMELLEDRRFALFHRFPENTLLIDPGFFPPRTVPLSTLPEEHGVTACKLLPFGHYYAYAVDPLTGERKLAGVTAPQKYLIAHNLPSHTTPEMLGKFFEQYDFVVEADVFKAPAPQSASPHQHQHNPPLCKGRGYVQFNSPSTIDNILSQTKSLLFFDQFVIFLESSDRIAKPVAAGSAGAGNAASSGLTSSSGGASSGGGGGPSPSALPPPPPQYHASFAPQESTSRRLPTNSSGGGGAGSSAHQQQQQQQQHQGHPMQPQPPQQHPRMQHHLGGGMLSHHHGHHGHHHGPPAAPGAIASSDDTSYFVTQIYEEHIQTSVRDGIFWPTKVNQKAFYASLERGQTFLIFFLVQRATLFGYARLTPRDMVRNKHANFTLEWVRNNIYLCEKELKTATDLNLFVIPDGTLIKPDIGDSICALCDKFGVRKMPDDAPFTPPPPATHAMGRGGMGNVSSGSGGFVASGGPPRGPIAPQYNKGGGAGGSMIAAPRSVVTAGQQQQQQQQQQRPFGNVHPAQGFDGMHGAAGGGHPSYHPRH